MFDKKAYMHEYNKKYRKIHKDTINARCNKFYIDNKKKILLEQKLNRENKRIREKELYRKGNNKKFTNYKYALRKKLAGKISIELLQKIYEDNIKKYGTLTCTYCTNIISFGYDSIDHKIPISRGGKSIEDNLCISCISCNCSKGSKTPEEYREFLCAL